MHLLATDQPLVMVLWWPVSPLTSPGFHSFTCALERLIRWALPKVSSALQFHKTMLTISNVQTGLLSDWLFKGEFTLKQAAHLLLRFLLCLLTFRRLLCPLHSGKWKRVVKERLYGFSSGLCFVWLQWNGPRKALGQITLTQLNLQSLPLPGISKESDLEACLWIWLLECRWNWHIGVEATREELGWLRAFKGRSFVMSK